jgi:hypothetical protein
MKRIFTFLLIAFSSVSLLFSQVIITKATHGFSGGQIHDGSVVTYQQPGAAGEDVIWDFSKVELLGNALFTSDIEDSFEGGNIKAVRDDGCIFFFNVTDKGNEYVGYEIGKSKMLLDKPILKTQYPQKFNTRFSGNFSGNIFTENPDEVTQVEGTYSTHADAWGTLLLPDGISLQALRVRTTEASGLRELVKYLWYTQGTRYPVFVTSEDYSIAKDGTRQLIYSGSFLNTQINKSAGNYTGMQNIAASPYRIFPNPFKNEIQVSCNLPEKTNVTISLYDVNGIKLTTLVSKEQSGNYTVSQDVSKYAQLPGIYLLKIQLGDKVYTEKLVKNQ